MTPKAAGESVRPTYTPAANAITRARASPEASWRKLLPTRPSLEVVKARGARSGFRARDSAVVHERQALPDDPAEHQHVRAADQAADERDRVAREVHLEPAQERPDVLAAAQCQHVRGQEQPEREQDAQREAPRARREPHVDLRAVGAALGESAPRPEH